MGDDIEELMKRLENALRAIAPDLQICREREGVLGGVISGPTVSVHHNGRLVAEIIVEDSETIWLGWGRGGDYQELFVQDDGDVEGVARRVARKISTS